MSKVQIIDFIPIILTKDKEFVKNYAKSWRMVPGAIIIIPNDAVLIKPLTKEPK